MAKRWLFIVLCLQMAVTGWCQTASIYRKFGVDEGLSEDASILISPGPRGRVLIKHPGLADLSWLNGYEVKKIEVPRNGIFRVSESPSGQIWAVWSEGLEEYNGKTWQKYFIKEIKNQIKSGSDNLNRIPLCPTRQGHVLFLLPDGLFELNSESAKSPVTQSIFLAADFKLGPFTGMTQSHDGGLWISCEMGIVKVSGPLRNISITSPRQLHRITDSNVLSVWEPTADEEGGVTCLAKTARNDSRILVHFNGRQWLILPEVSKDIIKAWRTPANSYWLAARDSVSLVKEENGVYHELENTPTRGIRDVGTESRGAFWLATESGAVRYAPSSWVDPFALKKMDSAVPGITEDAKGGFWLFSNGRLFRFLENQPEIFPLPLQLAKDVDPTGRIFSLPDGSVLIEGQNDLLLYQPTSARFDILPRRGGNVAIPLGYFQDGTLCLLSQGDSSTKSPKLESFDGKNFNPIAYGQPELDSNRPISRFYSSPNGDLWLIGKKFIARFHRKEWQVFSGMEGLVPEGAISLTEVSDGRIWSATSDKIWEFDGKTWSLIRSGFDQIADLMKSRDGSVWVATANGLFRYFQGAWAANNEAEGLPSREINTLYEDRRGRVWTGTQRGARIYHADADTDPPQTYIRPLKDGKNNLLEGEPIVINFNGQDKWNYTKKERLLYSHRLDEQDWSPFTEEKTTTLSDLAAGKHYFQVRSMDRNWNVDPKPALLEFAVIVPWYQETRILLITVTAIAGVVFFGALAWNRHRRLQLSYAEVEKQVAQRTKELELANQELLHSQKMNALGTLAAGIAHDFNNILSIIKGSAQIIEENVENGEKIKVRVNRIKTVVEQGSGIVRAMLGFSRSSDQQEQASEANLVVDETIRLLGDRFLREVEVQVHKEATLPEVPVSRDFIQQILLNFVFNAAESMTERKQIILRTALWSRLPVHLALAPPPAVHYVAISVEDFGTGIAPEIMPRIFEPFFTTKAFSARRGTGLGLSMVYELARKMQAGLAVDSTVGKGSTFTLIIPAGIQPVKTTSS